MYFSLFAAAPALRIPAVSSTLTATTSGVFADYPFYHSGDDLHRSVLQLAKSCKAPISVSHSDCGPDCVIDVVDIGDSKNTQKVFYLFGEHARELISPETALVLMEDLCSASPSSMAKAALKQSQLRIIPNGNPRSRRLVEQGQFCLRANMNGVDLNRNWGAYWTANAAMNTEGNQVNPGPHPFSEAETRVFQKAVADFEPTVFAAIHSGTLGMYMPWAYSKEADVSKIRNGEKMSAVLRELDTDFCQCPSGSAAREVGYDSPGTCLDWVHMHTGSMYSYAFEIFTGLSTEDLRRRYREQQQTVFRASFIELEEQFLRDNCFLQFNPETKADFDKTVANWSKALVELAVLTASK